MALWASNSKKFSVVYPIEELARRANLKVMVWDRGVPLAYTGGGFFQVIVDRLLKIKRWQEQGIKKVTVYYNPIYFVRNKNTINLLDPLHTHNVLKYEGSMT